MRRLAAVLFLLACGAAAEEPEWRFSFANGDRVHGGFAGIRNGRVHVVVSAAMRPVAVPLSRIQRADPQVPPDQPPRVAQVLRLRDGGALLGQCRAIDRGRVEFVVESIGVVTVPADEVADLLRPADAVRAYYRSVSDTPWSGEPLAPERHELLWTELGRSDVSRALKAHRELVRAGPNAVPMLADRMRVAPDAPEAIHRLIAALDDDRPETRLAAHRRLASLGSAAQPALEAAAREATSPEARQRIAQLLAALRDAEEGAEREPDPEVRQFVRAIHVLEEIGTPGARAVLERLANGPDSAVTVREARLAVERLRRMG